MSNLKKLKLNTITSLINQVVVVLSGLMLPRMYLLYFGTETYGLTASITQFLSIIVFLDLGVGSVVQSSLYKPLAKKNIIKTSLVLISARNYFRKIAYIIIVYILILAIIYPNFIQTELEFISTALLIFAMSISMFGRYYFGIINELLLNADQKSYVQFGAEIITVSLNLLFNYFLIRQGYSIQIVKLVSGLVFLLRPLFLSVYVQKNYIINFDLEITEEPIKQKWNGLAQHVANTIQNNTDIVILTIFSTLESVSVYAIHNMIVANLKTLFLTLSGNFKPLLGHLLANNETNKLNNYFNNIEWLVHTSVIFVFGLTAVLINSFIQIYTFGAEDVFYSPIFSFLLVVGQIIYLLRQPYHMMILAAGHYKETQNSSIIEAMINIIISTLLVSKLGIIGVSIGTIIALTYRTIYLVIYLSQNILYRPLEVFIKQLIINIITFLGIYSIGRILFFFFYVYSFYDWVIVAIIMSLLASFLVIILNFFFYRKNLFLIINQVLKR